MDLTGFRKPQSYYRDILWNGGNRVYATVRVPEPEGKKIIAIGWSVYPTIPSWTWPGQEGKSLSVEVYSGTETVRLYLNDKLIGEKPTGREQEFKATFQVPYAAGTLKVEGLKAGRVVTEEKLATTGAPMRLKLTADRSEISPYGQDLAFVTVEAVDEKGHVQMNADQEVHFAIAGPGTIAGLGSGDGQSFGSYQGNSLKLFQGRGLVVVRSARDTGKIQLSAKASGLQGSTVAVTTRPSGATPELQ